MPAYRRPGDISPPVVRHKGSEIFAFIDMIEIIVLQCVAGYCPVFLYEDVHMTLDHFIVTLLTRPIGQAAQCSQSHAGHVAPFVGYIRMVSVHASGQDRFCNLTGIRSKTVTSVTVNHSLSFALDRQQLAVNRNLPACRPDTDCHNHFYHL